MTLKELKNMDSSTTPEQSAAFMEKLNLFAVINNLIDFEVYILPHFYKRCTEYTPQVRRFDIDGCPVFALCFNNEWIESDWANYDMFLSENCSNFVHFATWEQAVKTALEFIETLKA
jgi:hypothetical protein